MNKTAIITLLICTVAFAQQKGSFTDARDGKTYKMVTIGEQTWMAQNLDYAGKNDDIGVCYNKKPANCQEYGALYTWNEAIKVCPDGWHLPSDAEWQTLVNFAGGEEIAGKKLKAKNGWNEYKCKYTTKETTGRGKVIETEHDECATDEFGFTALPGGYGGFSSFFSKLGNDGSDVGSKGNWWIYENGSAHYLYMTYYHEGVYKDHAYMGHNLFSVRCVQDMATAKTETIAKSSTVDMTPCGEYGKRFTYFRQSNEYMYEYCHWFIWEGHYDAKTGKLLTYKPTISEDTYQHIRNDFCTVIPEWGDRYVDEKCFQEKINSMQNIFFPKLFDQLKERVNIYRAGYENLGD